jgi:hypothetical protein
MKLNKRSIESFELDSNYYLNSFVYGNLSYVTIELSELFICSPKSFTEILIALPVDMQNYILRSDAYNFLCNMEPNQTIIY